MNFFLNYAVSDYLTVKNVARVFEGSPHTVWRNHHTIIGDNWLGQFEAAIRSLDGVLYIISPTAVDDPFCQWVISEAIRDGKPILPVQITAGEVPMMVRGRPIIDAVSGISSLARARLLDNPKKYAYLISNNLFPATKAPTEQPLYRDLGIVE